MYLPTCPLGSRPSRLNLSQIFQAFMLYFPTYPLGSQPSRLNLSQILGWSNFPAIYSVLTHISIGISAIKVEPVPNSPGIYVILSHISIGISTIQIEHVPNFGEVQFFSHLQCTYPHIHWDLDHPGWIGPTWTYPKFWDGPISQALTVYLPTYPFGSHPSRLSLSQF